MNCSRLPNWQEIETLKKDDGLQREIEFETKLHDLLGEYDYP